MGRYPGPFTVFSPHVARETRIKRGVVRVCISQGGCTNASGCGRPATRHGTVLFARQEAAETSPFQESHAKTLKVFLKYTCSIWGRKQIHNEAKQKTHAKIPAIGREHIIPVFWLQTDQAYLDFVYSCLRSFQLFFFFRFLSQSEAIHIFYVPKYIRMTTTAAKNRSAVLPTI